MIALFASMALAGEPSIDTGNGSAKMLSEADADLNFGVFRPWTIRLNDRLDLVTTGVIGSLVAPRADLKTLLVSQDDAPVSVALVVGASTPTPVLTAAKGWLYATDAKIPFAMMGKVQLLASRQIDRTRITFGAAARAGFAAGENDLTPRDFFFIDYVLAPITEGPVAGAFKVQLDYQSSNTLLWTVELNSQITGESFEATSRWFVLWGFHKNVAVGAGVFTNLDARPDGYRHYFIPGADVQFRL